MKLVPRRNTYDLFDNFFDNDDYFRYNKIMKTDISQNDNEFIIEVDLPGYSKENIDILFDRGYLKISAKVEKEDSNDYLRRERFYGECSRSFYLGEDIIEKDVNATFKNGILTIDIPKKKEQEKQENSKRIEIK